MKTPLVPGDRCYFLSKTGKKLRCIVADHLDMGRHRGEDQPVPIKRTINRKKPACNIDNPGDRVKDRVRWIKRSLLTKLPCLNNTPKTNTETSPPSSPSTSPQP